MKKDCASVITKDVAAALDRTKVTDRQAVFLLAATARGLGHNVSDLTLSRSSVQRARKLHCMEVVKYIKIRFPPNVPLTVHCDGKLLPDITGRENFDRLPVLVTGAGIEQLLGVPKIALE